MCMCHYYSSLLLFCSLQDRENAECLVFIHFPSSDLFKKKLPTPKWNTPHVGRLKRRRIKPFDTKKKVTLHPHPRPLSPASPTPTPAKNLPFTLKMACTVLSLSPSPPFGPVKKGKMGFLTVSFPDTFWAGWDFFQHVCSACSIWCQFVSFSLSSLLSSNTRLRETWRAV